MHKKLLKLITPKVYKSGAILSKNRHYRYALWRIWDERKPWVLFIGLNPSTADESHDDNTLKKCIHYASQWGYGGVYMANLFAVRATKPSVMKQHRSLIGSANDDHLDDLYNRAGIVVAAWGNDGVYQNRSAAIKDKYSSLYCMKVNKSGEPGHPLYLTNDASCFPFRCE